MKLIEELPKVFDDFGEQRKNSFITAMELKKKGIPMVGVFCTYLPQEFAEAIGAVTVSLCSVSEETIPDAEEVLPRNLCPLIKASYGFAKTDKCPYFYFSDLVIGETTCDGKKKMYEYLSEIKPVHVMELPNSQSENGLELWKRELYKLKQVLEERFGVEITEEKLREAVRRKNRERRALKAFYETMKLDPPPMSGKEAFNILNGASFRFDKEAMIEEIEAITESVLSREERMPKRPRILITGSPIGGVAEKLFLCIEEAGANVVAMECCSAAKSIDRLVDEEAGDIYEAIADRYLQTACSCMSPNPNRFELLNRIVDEYNIDGVIEVVLQACHTYNVEAYGVKRFVTAEKNIPYTYIETDYSTADTEQLKTRVSDFIEML